MLVACCCRIFHQSSRGDERGNSKHRIELLDAIDPSDVIDAAEQYARYIPVRVIGAMIGLPEEDCEMFTRWATDILQSHKKVGAFNQRRKKSLSTSKTMLTGELILVTT